MRLLLSIALAAGAASPICAATPAEWNRAIVEVADLDSLSLSPDGKLLLFRTSRPSIDHNRVVLEWHLLDTITGRTQSVASGGEAVFDDPGLLRAEAPLWLAGGKVALVRQRSAGATGIWAFRRTAGTFSPIVVGEADVENLRLAPDGLSALYDVGPRRSEIRAAEDRERDRGIRISPSVDLAQNLYRGGSVEGRRASQRLSGYWYMRAGLLASAPRQTRRWNSLTGSGEAVGAPRPPVPFALPSLTAVASIGTPGNGLAEAHWDGFSGRLEWRGPASAKRNCDAAMCGTMRVSSLAWVRKGRELLVTFADRHHRETLALWDLDRNRLRRLAAGEGLLSGGRRGSIPCQPGKNVLFCVRASAASPPELVQVSLADGTVSSLFDPNRALREGYRPRVEPIDFAIDDGRPVAGVILGNPGAVNAPLFINYYRCEGFLRGGEGDEWPVAALIDAGFLVACLNSVAFKGPQDARSTYDSGLAAVRTLVDRLADAGRIDRRKVAMGGFSFGSEVAMWTAIHSDLLAALSIASGQTEPTDYWYGAILGPAHDKVTREVWGLGRLEDTPEAWRQMSPAFNTGSISAPVLLQLPEQEARRIPELFVRLRSSGTPVDFYAFPGEPHIKVEPRHRAAVFDRNFDWLTYWLLGRRDTDAAKQEQYRRWDRMRAGQSDRAELPPAR